MNFRVRPFHHLRGMLLLESMIAILIFSVGILGILNMQANAIKEVSESKYRVDASYLAAQLIGQMWVSNRANLAANFNSPAGASFITWRAQVRTLLPGSDQVATQPTVVVDANNVATVTIFWQTTPAAAVHNFIAISQIRP